MTSRFLLAIDVGNTRSKFGVFEVRSSQPPAMVAITAVRHDAHEDSAHVLTNWLSGLGTTVQSGLIAGSNPRQRDQLLNSWPGSVTEPILISSASQIPLVVDVEQPASVGIDRLLTAFAATRAVDRGRSCIVVDSGTATTVNLVSAERVFLGGAILPGLRLSAHSLHDYTARLPYVDMDESNEMAAPLPARNTADAIRAGLFWGQLGAIREIRKRLEEQIVSDSGRPDLPVCLVTGGGGRQLTDHLEPCEYIDSLVLHGLALLESGSQKQITAD